MLVHESSHQHFFLAKHLGPIDDGSDKNQYFSPMVNDNRPLEKMLLAYHALINMGSLYRAMKGLNATHQDFVSKRIGYIFKKLEHVEPVVRDARAFSEMGQAIYDRLAEEEVLIRKAFLQ